jgi:N-methylhydantoinase A
MCYSRGGDIPTVTDADVVLGYLSPSFFLGGRMTLDIAQATSGMDALGQRLNLGASEAAWAVHEVVNENMANAARVHAVEAGADLHRLPLFAFGGAGPVHAYRVALNLGMPVVIAPLGAGVGSTIGLLAAPLVFDYVRSAVMPLADIEWPIVEAMVAEMESNGTELLVQAGVDGAEVSMTIAADMRLTGQAHEITVDLGTFSPTEGAEGQLRAAFDETYTALFGRQPPDVDAEVVSWRVRVAGPRPAFPIQAPAGADLALSASSDPIKGAREAYFPESGGFAETPVYDRYLLRPGMSLAGPAIIEERESTLVVGPGGRASIDDFLNVIVEL